MLKIQEAIVVEGRYDKNTLSQLVDALIITTDGFGIFKDKKKKALLRNIAQKRGIIILTDSDGAGFVIRNHLKSILPPEQIKQAYIPDIQGKERRKRVPGKEGKLGVEGMRPEVLEQALRAAGATIEHENAAVTQKRSITKQDLYADGFSGRPDSQKKRALLLKELDLPEHITTNALVQILDRLLTYEEYKNLASKLQHQIEQLI